MGLFRLLDSDNYRRKARRYKNKEKYKYAIIINEILRGAAYCNPKISIDTKSDDLYVKLRDGIIVVKLVNLCESDVRYYKFK